MTSAVYVLMGLTAIAGLIIAIYGIVLILRTNQSRYWPRTVGRVVSSQCKRDPSGEYPQWRISIEFEYAVEGRQYRSKQITFRPNHTPPEIYFHWENERGAKSLLEAYPVDTIVHPAFKPDDPATAVLRPGINRYGFLLLLAGLTFLLPALLVILGKTGGMI